MATIYKSLFNETEVDADIVNGGNGNYNNLSANTLVVVDSLDLTFAGTGVLHTTAPTGTVTASTVVNADIDITAGIEVNKLQVIPDNTIIGNISGAPAVPGLVPVTSLSTPNTIVKRDAFGAFSAVDIFSDLTGSVTGNATSASSVATTATATNADFFPLFTDSSSSVIPGATVNVNNGLLYNPATKRLKTDRYDANIEVFSGRVVATGTAPDQGLIGHTLSLLDDPEAQNISIKTPAVLTESSLYRLPPTQPTSTQMLTSTTAGVMAWQAIPVPIGAPPYAPVLVYVSQVFGNDVNDGSYGSPVATFTQALILAPGGPPPASTIICLDGATYDEAITIPNNVFIEAPSATIQTIATAGDCITITGFCDITFDIIQSTTGAAVRALAGYPVVKLGDSFAGDFNNDGTGQMVLKATSIAGAVNHTGGGVSLIILTIARPPGGGTTGTIYSDWSNSLPPYP